MVRRIELLREQTEVSFPKFLIFLTELPMVPQNIVSGGCGGTKLPLSREPEVERAEETEGESAPWDPHVRYFLCVGPAS